ncbi:hypothetical protein MKW94_008233 [Papaver nudicaule]|uniref:Uncharacterized protein n=1 Tax=Papaver nudicaule TaxID=74823 RepID=A0AA41S4T6_PAPNU|nr:hypothetical protein [Papaver nudicaule]
MRTLRFINNSIKMKSSNFLRKWFFFLVLGKQSLAELRDRIYCSTDQLMQKKKKNNTDVVDYNEFIFDWLKNSKKEALEKWDWILSGPLQAKQKALFGDTKTSHLPDFRAVDMHKICFCDLSCRLGVRLIHPEDEQNRADYTVFMFQTKDRFEKCYFCKIYSVTKVTVEDKWAQENPCYFCDNFYYLVHYNEDGSLLYDDYTIYDYHHD